MKDDYGLAEDGHRSYWTCGGYLGLDSGGGGGDGRGGYRNALCVSSSVAILGYPEVAGRIGFRI